jgi:hypothetical protein
MRRDDVTLTKFPRPCPIPGHPQDDAPGPLSPDSAWSRLWAWHLHAPAERLPLPLIVLIWPSAWVLRAVHVPGRVVAWIAAAAVAVTWLTWRRHARTSSHPRLAAAETAMVAAVIGAWIAAAVTSGPLGWPAHLLSWIYLGGAFFGYRWLRGHPAVLAARKRRDDHAEWTARKAEWRRIAHLIGLGDFHLQSVTPTRLGEELLLTSAPGSELATRVAANSRPYAEKFAHLRGLPYGRSTSAPPSTRGSWSSRSGKRTRRSTARSPTPRWTRTRPTRTGSPSRPASGTRSRSG